MNSLGANLKVDANLSPTLPEVGSIGNLQRCIAMMNRIVSK